ncbi:hypothetical protein Adt_19546 [Abeliophyllum distichum]|uniref:Uncharacterized protein n=1 Tax=Abeliophyllum distichum TaxID=126358 RepID=A0ABD1STD3_9LAMI
MGERGGGDLEAAWFRGLVLLEGFCLIGERDRGDNDCLGLGDLVRVEALSFIGERDTGDCELARCDDLLRVEGRCAFELLCSAGDLSLQEVLLVVCLEGDLSL